MDIANHEQQLKKLNRYEKINYIISLTDDNIKIALLKFILDDSDKSKIIETVKDEKLILEGIKFIKEDYSKAMLVSKLSDIQLIEECIKLIKTDFYKINVIKKIPSEMDRLKLLSQITEEHYKIDIIKTIQDEKIKEKSVSTLNSDKAKAQVINTIVDENVRYSLLHEIKSDIEKCRVIENLGEILKIKSIELLTIESVKLGVIIEIKNETAKIELLKYVDEDSNKSKIIETVEDEKLIFEGIKTIKDDYYKTILVSKLTDIKLIEECIKFMNIDFHKINVIKKIHNEIDRLSFLNYMQEEYNKLSVLKTIKDENLRVIAISMFVEDKNKKEIINTIENETLRLKLLETNWNEEEQNILISQIISDKISNNKLDNYLQIINLLFSNGLLDCLWYLDKKLFDDKQNKILSEYKKIQNPKIKKYYSNYICANYESINMDNIDKISQILFRIEMSNSSELQAFGDLIANAVLNHEDPLLYFSKIEDIFVKNHIPYVGKVFEVFKLLHSDPNTYKNYSPLLNRFNNSKHQMQMMDLILFNDLLKCAFSSNNRSLKKFFDDIGKGNQILVTVANNKELLNSLNNYDKNMLIKYLEQIEITLDSYDKWKDKKTDLKTNEDILSKINYLTNRLKLRRHNYEDIPDIIIKKLCGISGIDTFEKAKKYIEYVTIETDKRNREKSKTEFTLEEGDFVKGINDIKYLSKILQNGSVCKEFLGASADSDLTPLDTDLSRILSKNIVGRNQTQLGSIISSTISGGYGTTWFVLKNDPSRIEITKNSNNKNNHNLAPKFSKLEAFQTLNEGHYGIRTGFATSEIDYIVSKSHFDRIGLEIAMNGFYIPVVDTNGKLVFTPNDYDILRSKMTGLTYYDESKYSFSNNLVNADTLLIAEQIQQSNIETKKKRELINLKIKEALLELDLTLKDRIDGDLSEGIVELIDTGSTGRGTNKPGDGDFDFMMRLDKSILSNSSKMDELRKNILLKLGKNGTSELTSEGDFRLKDVKISEDTIVDIDITFTGKTDKVSYSTDMCLQDRLTNIYNQDPKQYDYVVANILLAKQVLKQGDVYKPNRGEKPQGGLGGVGIETWILQNGGSFMDAAKNFLEVAEGKKFEEFKNSYYVWDFGENHMAERRDYYAHDNFVANNMSESGYNKMVQVLKDYIKNYDINHEETLTDELKQK